MTITYEEAIDKLRANPSDYDTKEKLLKLVQETSIEVAEGHVQGRVTVLYSGWATADAHTEDVVKALIANGEDVRLIDKAQAAKLLQSETFLNAVGRLEGVSIEDMLAKDKSFPIKNWLFDKDPNSGPWASTSQRFAADTAGEVRLLVARSEYGRVFGTVELPEVLSGNKVTTVDGFTLTELRSMGFQFLIGPKMEYITATAALKKLTDNLDYYTTAERLMELVDEVSIERTDGLSHGRITVLYSGGVTQPPRPLRSMSLLSSVINVLTYSLKGKKFELLPIL